MLPLRINVTLLCTSTWVSSLGRICEHGPSLPGHDTIHQRPASLSGLYYWGTNLIWSIWIIIPARSIIISLCNLHLHLHVLYFFYSVLLSCFPCLILSFLYFLLHFSCKTKGREPNTLHIWPRPPPDSYDPYLSAAKIITSDKKMERHCALLLLTLWITITVQCEILPVWIFFI